MVIINPSNGRVDFAKAFDTYKSSDAFVGFVHFIEETKKFTDGHIIVVACQDDCVYKLSFKAKRWFEKQGAKQIWDLEYR